MDDNGWRWDGDRGMRMGFFFGFFNFGDQVGFRVFSERFGENAEMPRPLFFVGEILRCYLVRGNDIMKC